MKKIKFLLIGGMVAIALAGCALADISISTYRVDGFSSDNLEVGATFRSTIRYTNNTGVAKSMVGAKFYIDYDTNYVDVIGESAIADSLSSSLISKTNPNFTPVDGQIRYQRDAAGGAGLSVADGQTIDCLTITFHLKQQDSNNGSRQLLTWVLPKGDNVKLLAAGNEDIAGNVADFQNATLCLSAAPTFAGLNTVANPATGNTLNLNWAVNGNIATDLTSGAASYYDGHNGEHNGQGLRYNIYSGTVSPPTATLMSAMNAFAYTNSGLNDGTMYYYRTRSQDSCTPNHNEDANNTIVSGIPTDHTPPAAPATFTAGSGNQLANLNWSAVSGDVGGYLVIRYSSAPASEPPLRSARDNDPSNLGLNSGDVYNVRDSIGGGTVIYNGTGTSMVDTGADLTGGNLTNGTIYYYKVFAYDPVGGTPVQQGRNYSPARDASCAPGVAPEAVTNFYAISRPVNKITLRWDNSADYAARPQGGTVIWYTADVDRKWQDISNVPANWANANSNVKLLAIKPRETEATSLETMEIDQDIAGTKLSTAETYFFKAYAYNKTGTDLSAADLSNADRINSYQFSSGVMAAGVPAFSGGNVVNIHGATVEVIVTLEAGVNAVGIPFSPPFSTVYGTGTYANVVTMQDLVDSINTAAGKQIVSAVAYWDKKDKALYGATYNLEGNIIDKNFKGDKEPKDLKLKDGLGCQISVYQPIEFKFVKKFEK